MRVRYKNVIILAKSLTQTENIVTIDVLVDKEPVQGYSRIRRLEVILDDKNQASAFMNDMLTTGYKDLRGFEVNCSYAVRRVREI